MLKKTSMSWADDKNIWHPADVVPLELTHSKTPFPFPSFEKSQLAKIPLFKGNNTQKMTILFMLRNKVLRLGFSWKYVGH